MSGGVFCPSAPTGVEVIKKYDFPTVPPYDESQKEDQMVHLMNQAIGQAFLSHAPIMANSVRNVVLNTL